MRLTQTIAFSLLSIVMFIAAIHPATGQDLFNLGRFKIFRGFSFSSDQKEIFFDSYTSAPYSGVGKSKIYTARWSDGKWSKSELLDFLPGDTHHTPIISTDNKRLYFTSSSPAPGKTEEGDQNIWYVERNGLTWGKPIFLKEINTDSNERLTSVIATGDIFFASNRSGGSGDSDIYYSTKTNSGFSNPVSLEIANSSKEEFVFAVDPQKRFGILQRRPNAYTVEVLISFYDGKKWLPLQPLQYKRLNPTAISNYYAPRFVYLASGGNTLYYNINFLPYSHSLKKILKENNINSNGIAFHKEKPLPIAKRKYGEPVPFGANQLQTNNGFRLSPDGKTAYVAQYTPKLTDTTAQGEQRMVILESRLKRQKWSELKPVSFGDPNVHFEYYPVLAPNGKRMYFNSRANAPGSKAYNHKNKNNLFYVDQLPDGTWGPRQFMAGLATENADEDYCSQAADGTLYFHSDRPNGDLNGDIYTSEPVNGEYTNPKKIDILSSPDNDGNVFVDPEERFIILIRSLVNTRKIHEIDLFISFRSANGWSAPRSLNQINTVNNWELTPFVSSDGKYFYYEQTQNIFRVEFESLLTPEESKMMQTKTNDKRN